MDFGSAMDSGGFGSAAGPLESARKLHLVVGDILYLNLYCELFYYYIVINVTPSFREYRFKVLYIARTMNMVITPSITPPFKFNLFFCN